MEALTVVNGILDRKVAGNVEKYARLSGFQICSVDYALSWNPHIIENVVFTDRAGAHIYQEFIEELAQKGCPVIIVPVSQREALDIQKYRKHISARAVYPFLYKDFCILTGSCIDTELMLKRNLYYGNLRINTQQRKIVYKNEEVKLGPFEYDILLYLLNHIGVAINREKINQILPERKRDSLRNVDTHIKNIRRYFDMKKVIVSVRSIGYRIDPEMFFQWIMQAEL